MNARTPHHDRQLLADLAALDRLDQQPPPPVMVTCGACAHFRPGLRSQADGLGLCSLFNGHNFAGAKRYCKKFEEAVVDA